MTHTPLFRAALAASLAALLSACAAERLPAPPAYAEWSRPRPGPTPERVLAPRPSSPEFQRSWGLKLVNAEPAFRAGYTGRGVTIAVIDTGLGAAPAEVRRQASPASTDLIVRAALMEDSPHGGAVAGTAAAALDGDGVVGVAYGATVLSIRADLPQSCRSQCAFDTADLARGLDYAVDHGARIIVLAAEGPHRLQPAFEAALARATAAGAVVVVAAGNEAAADPTWPARYAADPRFARSVIAVGAADASGELTAWSNRAGAAAPRFLYAPGRRVVADCDTRVCLLLSGTSFSAPYVAGALALLMEARPELGAQDAAELLLASGRSEGRRAVYGRGLLDIGEALRRARSPARTLAGA